MRILLFIMGLRSGFDLRKAVTASLAFSERCPERRLRHHDAGKNMSPVAWISGSICNAGVIYRAVSSPLRLWHSNANALPTYGSTNLFSALSKSLKKSILSLSEGDTALFTNSNSLRRSGFDIRESWVVRMLSACWGSLKAS